MASQTTRNMIGVLQAVALYAREHKLTPGQALKAARMAIVCVMSEGNGHMYANTGVPLSLRIPHDAKGSDHDSVGMYQQRVGMPGGGNAHGWGNVHQAMDIKHSTYAFLDRARARGLLAVTLPKGKRAYNDHLIRDVFDRVQDVQVSWADGLPGHPAFAANYRANRARSWAFLVRYWNTKTRSARSSINYL